MNPVLQPWHLMVMLLASWINRQQQEFIEYLLMRKKRDAQRPAVEHFSLEHVRSYFLYGGDLYTLVDK